jgi:hypothetical protein
MASSPADRGATPAAAAMPSATAFALQELIACWDQGYEALARGDLERVQALLDIADDHLRALPGHACDTATETALRAQAIAARGRLEHGMHSGLDGLQQELTRLRQGAKVLQGYGNASVGLGGNVARTV